MSNERLTPRVREHLRDVYRVGGDVYIAAREFAISRDAMRVHLRAFITPADRQARRAHTSREEYAHDQIVAAIRSVRTSSSEVGPTVTEYRREARTNPALPSIATLTNRYGTYNAALVAAGYRRPTGVRSDRRWDRAQVVDSLREIVTACDGLPSIAKYERVRRDFPQWPSSATIRVRIGSWSEARTIGTRGQ